MLVCSLHAEACRALLWTSETLRWLAVGELSLYKEVKVATRADVMYLYATFEQFVSGPEWNRMLFLHIYVLRLTYSWNRLYRIDALARECHKHSVIG